jgi:hypothetical protein
LWDMIYMDFLQGDQCWNRNCDCLLLCLTFFAPIIWGFRCWPGLRLAFDHHIGHRVLIIRTISGNPTTYLYNYHANFAEFFNLHNFKYLEIFRYFRPVQCDKCCQKKCQKIVSRGNNFQTVWRSEAGFAAMETSSVMTLKNRKQGGVRGSDSTCAFGRIGKEIDRWSGWINERRRRKIISHLLCSTPEAKK